MAEWVTRREAAAISGVSPSTIDRLIKRGDVVAVKRDSATGQRWEIQLNDATIDRIRQLRSPASPTPTTVSRRSMEERLTALEMQLDPVQLKLTVLEEVVSATNQNLLTLYHQLTAQTEEVRRVPSRVVEAITQTHIPLPRTPLRVIISDGGCALLSEIRSIAGGIARRLPRASLTGLAAGTSFEPAGGTPSASASDAPRQKL